MDEMRDVFISHHTDSCHHLVTMLAKNLEVLGVTCWYSERDIKSARNYTEEIPEALENCRLFVLLLNEYSNQSEEVLRELNRASKLPWLVFRLDRCRIRNAVSFTCSTSQIKEYNETNQTLLAQLMSKEISTVLKDEQAMDLLCQTDGVFCVSRSDNPMAFYAEEVERKRLALQQQYITRFAKDTYDSLLEPLSDAVFLDVGCNTGKQAHLLLEGHRERIQYVGIDHEEEALEQGRLAYPDGQFYRVELEKAELDERLTAIENELGIDGFDVINLSMVLLHLKEPHVVIDVLENHLNENGVMIVLDIDDGLMFANPDPDGRMKHAVELCQETLYSGYRHSGREVYGLLFRNGLEHVVLHKAGLSTVGMTRKERGELFDIYFQIVLDDLRKMHEMRPKHRLIAAEWEWIEEKYPMLRNFYKQRDTVFQLGFMLFSARR